MYAFIQWWHESNFVSLDTYTYVVGYLGWYSRYFKLIGLYSIKNIELLKFENNIIETITTK